MQIGASFNAPSLPQRPAAATVAPAQPDRDRDTARPGAAAEQADSSIDPGKTRSRPQTDSAGFYSTDRALSARGQEAMQTYLTTAGFQFGNARPELVGVDVYA
ncbi:MAG: hypothetical protein ACI9W6_000645 [Motiliproteus sp.]|jgi:hypothetical protein